MYLHIQIPSLCDISRGIKILKEKYTSRIFHYNLLLNKLHKTCALTHETSYTHYLRQDVIKFGIPKLWVNSQVCTVLYVAG